MGVATAGRSKEGLRKGLFQVSRTDRKRLAYPGHPGQLGRIARATALALLMSPLASPAPAWAAFTNGDFEGGNFTGWTKTLLQNNKIPATNHAITPKALADLNLGTPGSGTDLSLIVTGATGSTEDAVMAGYGSPIRYPYSGTHTALVNLDPTGHNIARSGTAPDGNSWNFLGKRGSSIKQRATVTSADVDPSDGKIHVRFVLAPVLDNPGLAAPLTGTVSTTSGSATVTGVGTQFTTQLHVNDDVYFGSGTSAAKVLSITSDTSFTLAANASSSQSGVAIFAGPAGAHFAEEQPYFAAELRKVDSGGNPVAVAGAPASSPGQLFFTFNFSNQPGTVWGSATNTTDNHTYTFSDFQAFDIAPGNAKLAVGDTVELEVVAVGCSKGGHEAHIYVDNFSFLPPAGLWVAATGPASVSDAAGTTITYTYQYTNNTGNTVNNVVVAPAMPQDNTATPQDTTYVSSSGASCSPSGGAAAVPPTAGGALSCSLGTLAAGQTGSFTVTVKIPGSAVGPINNGNYPISGTGVLPLSGPLVQTALVPAATLSDPVINKSGLPTSASLGVPYSGTYTCANTTGPAAATNASCDAANLPAGLSVTGCQINPGATAWTQPGNIPAGSTVTCTVGGTPSTPGSVTATVSTGADNDANTANNTATVTIQVSAQEVPPAARNDSGTTPLGTAITLPVLSNDSPGSGSSLVQGSVDLDPATPGQQTTRTVAGQGTFVANANGTVTFTPVSGYQGVVSIPYVVQDSEGRSSNTAMITVTVLNTSPASPVAQNDSATTGPATPVVVPVLGNDQAGSGNTLNPATLTLSNTTPAQGTWSVNPANGQVTFTPAAGFKGTASATYVVQDSGGGSTNSASITVLVAGGSAPAAQDDSGTTRQGTPVTLAVASNDTAGSGNTLTPPVVLSGTNPAQGSWTANADGTVTFTPAAGFTGVATANYTVSDSGSGTSNTARISVTVTPAAPAASNDVAPHGVRTLHPASNDTASAGAVLNAATVDLDPATPGIQRTMTTAQGTWTVTDAVGTVNFIPVSGFIGTASLPYAISDSLGNTASATMSVPIDPSGVIYNSIARTPLSGATVTLLYNGGSAAAYVSGSTTQTTNAQGQYAFFLTGTPPAGTFSLSVTLAGYSFTSTAIPPQAGSWPAGGGAITPISGAPQAGDPTTYYLSGPFPASDITNNNIPLDPAAAAAPVDASPIPTLGEWGVLGLGVILAGFGMGGLSRRQRYPV